MIPGFLDAHIVDEIHLYGTCMFSCSLQMGVGKAIFF